MTQQFRCHIYKTKNVLIIVFDHPPFSFSCACILLAIHNIPQTTAYKIYVVLMFWWIHISMFLLYFGISFLWQYLSKVWTVENVSKMDLRWLVMTESLNVWKEMTGKKYANAKNNILSTQKISPVVSEFDSEKQCMVMDSLLQYTLKWSFGLKGEMISK